jgi:hypothetical protein
MAPQKLEADLQVGAFGLTLDDQTRRLDFPRGTIDNLRGVSGKVTYGAREVSLDKLGVRLDRTQWRAESASAGDLFLRAEGDAVLMTLARIEMPRGLTISRAEGGVEIIAPHASLHDVLLRVPDLGKLRGSKAEEVATEAATALVHLVDQVPLRAEKLRWLDTLDGEIRMTFKVVLDLPLVGTRTLDQVLRIPIKDGSLDFRALDASLNWLEGAFVDLGMRGDRLVLSWRVPIVGSRREILSWELDPEARTLATFDRVPLRSLGDFRTPGGAAQGEGGSNKKKSPLRSLTLSDLQVKLSMVAPRSVEIGHGAILFGGDDEPGLVGLELNGHLFHPPAPGGLTGAIGAVDITAKDVGGGPVSLTVDRLHFGDLETFELSFDGFHPVGLTARIHRITASNLSLRLGRGG